MARTQRIRWLSALVGVALAVSALVVVAGSASSSPQLPQITPQQLIASVARAARANGPVSGDVTARIDLGIPSLSEQLAQAAPDASTLLTSLSGDHRIRMWRSADGLRVADLVAAGERDLYVSRRDAWGWDSASYTAYHLGPFQARFGRTAIPRERTTLVPGRSSSCYVYQCGPLLPDPNELAARALQAIDPSTSVSMEQPRRVAGRDAYVLVLQPRTGDTLVGRVEISVDAVRRVPLGVDVFPRNAVRAAVSVDFTSVSFGAIKPSTFDFSPPAGAHVVSVGDHEHGGRCDTSGGACLSAPTVRGGTDATTVRVAPAFRTFGSGWATIDALRLPASSQLITGGQGRALTELLPFSGPLFSVRLVDRGDHSWLIAGLVPQAALVKVQAELL